VATRVAVIEPFHSPFYAPLFVALHGGHFAAEGLDVTVRTAPVAGGTVQALLDGTADVALGGLMRTFELADRGGPLLPHFAEANSRNGFFLVARAPEPTFRFADLAGKTVISFAEAPTPWQCMLTVLRRHGVDPGTVTIERTRPVADAVAAFLAGHADYLEQAQPAIEQLLAAGRVHLVVSMGEATGPVPFSSYVATRETLRARRPLVLAFARAACRAQRWMAAHGSAEVARVVQPAYPEVGPTLLERIVDRYQRQGTWPGDPTLRPETVAALQQILLDGGFIRQRHRYEDVVDAVVAEQVVRELG
jgi:NitT/TauT family transport system substrate-binding protein